jgi:hypothetical protein
MLVFAKTDASVCYWTSRLQQKLCQVMPFGDVTSPEPHSLTQAESDRIQQTSIDSSYAVVYFGHGRGERKRLLRRMQ